jgi:hypothetical protein
LRFTCPSASGVRGNAGARTSTPTPFVSSLLRFVFLLTTVISILYASQHACAAWRPNKQTIAHAALAGSRDASTKPTAFFSLAHRIHAGGTSHCMFCSFANGMASSSRLQSADTLVDTQIHSQISLCKKKISHHIKISAHIWSTKCRLNQKLIAQFCCTLRDEYFKPN